MKQTKWHATVTTLQTHIKWYNKHYLKPVADQGFPVWGGGVEPLGGGGGVPTSDAGAFW